jgi:hypothetical protein
LEGVEYFLGNGRDLDMVIKLIWWVYIGKLAPIENGGLTILFGRARLIWEEKSVVDELLFNEGIFGYLVF